MVDPTLEPWASRTPGPGSLEELGLGQQQWGASALAGHWQVGREGHRGALSAPMCVCTVVSVFYYFLWYHVHRSFTADLLAFLVHFQELSYCILVFKVPLPSQ